jgi:DNA-binding CsgD family transcriptional regulator
LARALIDPAREGADGALAVLGDAGIGRSALLANLAAQARAQGLRVLSAAGREGEAALPFSALMQLLSPVLAGPHAMDPRAVVFRATVPDAAPDWDQAGSTLLDLLAAHAEESSGVLIVIDDAQWIDSASLRVLGWIARRLDARPVSMILAARGDVLPAGIGRGVPQLRLGPLDTAHAGELLDSQPCPPQGRARAQVLAQAAGNPLALIELARAITDDPAAERGCAGLPLPLTTRLGAVFAPLLGQLPAATRHALLLAAAADATDRDAVARAHPGPDPAVLAPAENLGLIRLDTAGARFRHPLIRSAAYHDAPFASRAAAHRQLADLLHGQPDRRAWHLAAATLGADEDIASLLAATASEARRRGGSTAMALALERSAGLSPDPHDRAQRLMTAAEAAVWVGQTQWARDLTSQALMLTSDPNVRSRCRHLDGWALTLSGRYANASKVLLSLAREGATDHISAWSAISLGATAAYQSGDPGDIQAVADVLAALPAAGHAHASRAWALAVTGRRPEAAALLRQLRTTAASELDLHHAGAAAWLLDHTTDAIRLLGSARSASAEPGTWAAHGGPLAALGWAYLDAGQWNEALELVAGARITPEAYASRATCDLISATIEAARGNTGPARDLVAAALAADPEHSRVIAARARHALGLCALAEDDYVTAFSELSQLFDDNGTPYHHHVSFLAAGDLALAAARSGRHIEGREILKRITASRAASVPWCSPRLSQLLARAYAILADPSAMDAYPDDVLSDPAGDQWPFERAQFHLEYGEWLRRRRLINQARQVLSAALAAFRALKAGPWARRAETELRACGITIPSALADPAKLAELTPQQRQVVGLAAQGLSNREIARRLFLSHRTVASHLYRSFPTLGVAGRHQLHALLAQSGHPG